MIDTCGPLPAIISGAVGIVLGWMIGTRGDETAEAENKKPDRQKKPDK